MPEGKFEIWLLERQVVSLEEEIKSLIESSFVGQFIENVRDRPWAHRSFDWISGGLIESTLALEKEVGEINARLSKLRQLI